VGLLLAGVSGAVAALGDTLFPSHTLADALRAELSQTGHLLIRLRLLHPVLAVGAATLAVWLGFWLKRRRPLPMVARFSDWTGVLALVQLGLGGLDVLLLAPSGSGRAPADRRPGVDRLDAARRHRAGRARRTRCLIGSGPRGCAMLVRCVS
jgi:hypothetical protein